ncbi:hypothetical protein FPG3_02185 [Flavobacterium psychrophilum FPG3]|nr:hypothetical protein FPG3_02185 [Flavobacterium psychrophilum FPG3]
MIFAKSKYYFQFIIRTTSLLFFLALQSYLFCLATLLHIIALFSPFFLYCLGKGFEILDDQ